MIIGGVIIYVDVVRDVVGIYLVLVVFVGYIGDLVVCNCGIIGGLFVNNDFVVCYFVVVLVFGVII